MKLVWTLSSWDDYEFWQRTDARMVEKINDLIRNANGRPLLGSENRSL